MKVLYKKGGGAGFAKKESYEYDGVKYEADIKNGDIVKILDGGNMEQGQFGEQNNFKIKTRNGEKKVGFNQATINILLQEFGDETENWIGKEVKVLIVKKMIAGKKAIIPYLIVDGWELDEFGALTKLAGNSQFNDAKSLPEINIEEEVNSEDLPF